MPTFLSDEPIKFAKDIAERAGCSSEIIDDLNDCLKDLSTLELLQGFKMHAVGLLMTAKIGNFEF